MLDELFMQILDMSKVASIAIVAVMLARLLLKKAPKWISYALWAVVLMRLVCPISVSSSVSIVPEMGSVSEGYTLADEPISVFGAGEAAYRAVGDALNGGLGTQYIRTTEKTEDGMTRYVTTDWWSVWLLVGQYVWVAGVVAMALYSAVSYAKLRRSLRVCAPLRENVFIADDIQSPFVIGLVRPKIYLPCGLGEQEQEYIILHEQHHIRRFDHIIKTLAFFALTLHWFNPLVWAAFILACRDMEMSCDEAVIGKLGAEIRADYSASLLTLATGRRIIAGVPLAFGEGDTRGRIKNLANWKKPALWGIVAALVACAVLAVCLLTDSPEDDVGNETMESFVGIITDISESEPYCLVKVTDSASSTLAVGDRVFVHTVLVGGREVIADNSEITVGDHIEVCFNGVVTQEVGVSMADARIRIVFSIEEIKQVITEPTSQEQPWESVMRVVNKILVGALRYDESWQSGGVYTLTVTGADGETDRYLCVPGTAYAINTTEGHQLAEWYTWTACGDSGESAESEYHIHFQNENYSLTVFSDSERIALTENGETRYFEGKYKYADETRTNEYSYLFQHFLQYALMAEGARGEDFCTVDGDETDYAVIARKLTEQYAEVLCTRPAWYHQIAHDAIFGDAQVFDAYYGEDDPNFCFNMILYVKVDDENVNYWQAGAGIEKMPDGSGYDGYYYWGREVQVRRNEDGDWHLDGLNSGGCTVRLPIVPEEASAQELTEMFFLTDGFTHDYRLLYYLAQKPLDEVLEQMNALKGEQRESLRSAIIDFIEDYPDYTAWTTRDFS